MLRADVFSEITLTLSVPVVGVLFITVGVKYLRVTVVLYRDHDVGAKKNSEGSVRQNLAGYWYST